MSGIISFQKFHSLLSIPRTTDDIPYSESNCLVSILDPVAQISSFKMASFAHQMEKTFPSNSDYLVLHRILGNVSESVAQAGSWESYSLNPQVIKAFKSKKLKQVLMRRLNITNFSTSVKIYIEVLERYMIEKRLRNGYFIYSEIESKQCTEVERTSNILRLLK